MPHSTLYVRRQRTEPRIRPVLRPLAILLVAASAGLAADGAPRDEEILLDEWRQMTEGRTVHYSLDGRHWGREHFHPGGVTATFMTADGQCASAPWTYASGVYCFAYSGMDCFRHVRRGGRLFAIPLGGGAEQEIVRITAEPLSCEPPPVS
jgi:hypothetical protein